MSETKCKCGYPIRFLEAEEGENERPAMWIHTGGYGRQCPIYAEPAEPVIEVAPGEPTCEYCGPVCYRGAEHNARVEDGSRYTDDPVPAVPELRLPDSFGSMGPSQAVKDWGERFEALAHTAVPAQEAPRECDWWPEDSTGRKLRPCGETLHFTGEDNPRTRCKMKPGHTGDHSDGNTSWSPTEPQAGAQVPSPDYKEMWLKAVDLGLTQHIIKVRENTKLREELGRVNTHLDSIKSYATEAAKTPITRESILAVPQVDEAPIPENLKMAYGMYKKSGLGGPAELIERIAQLEAENRARKLTQLSQCDELQGLIRLVLSEIGGGL